MTDSLDPTKPVDLVVIGGGINGTAIARDAALRGLSVILVERDDLAVGASAWNSRMIHGGIRYLEHGEFRLVYESLHEREQLLHTAPHLVKPYQLMIPFYRHNHRPAWMLGLGMTLYDMLSFGKSTPNRSVLGRKAVHVRWPGLTEDGLRGGGTYYDTQVAWAERLSIENAIAAARSGASIRTHVTATAILHDGGRIRGIAVTDELTGATGEIRAGAVINAAGANLDSLVAGTKLIGGTKGTHILVEPFPGAPDTAIHYEAVSDGRAILILPWEGRYLIGATDIYVDGDPALIRTDRNEIAYLLAETNRLIPDAALTTQDVLWSYVGVRPLPYSPGADSSADVSRDHVIHDHAPDPSGLWSIIGGKLTTHRALAEQTVDAIVRYLQLPGKRKIHPTRSLALPGGETADWPRFREHFLATTTLPRETAEHVLDVYGTRARMLEELAVRMPALRQEVAPTMIAAEIANAFDNEFARTVTDVLLRRTMIGLIRFDYAEHGRTTAEIAAALGYLPASAIEQQTAEYVREATRLLPSPAAGATIDDEGSRAVAGRADGAGNERA